MDLYDISPNTPYYRFSTRKYSEKNIDIDSLKEYSKNIIPLFDRNAFKIVLIPREESFLKELKGIVGNYGKIDAPYYGIVYSTQKNKQNFLQAGFLMEQLVLKATEINIQSCYIGSKMSDKLLSEYVDNSKLWQPMIIVAFGKAKQMPKEIVRKGKTRNDICSYIYKEKKKRLDLGFDCIMQAPSAMNLRPYLFVVRGKYIDCYVKKQILGSISKQYNNLKYIDLGIALLHFYLGIGTQLEIETCNVEKIKGNEYMFSLLIDKM